MGMLCVLSGRPSCKSYEKLVRTLYIVNIDPVLIYIYITVTSFS